MFILKKIIDTKINEKHGRLYACFVDFRKAFDTVIHAEIKFKLLKANVGTKIYKIIKSMYAKSRSCGRVDDLVAGFFNINVGVTQGDNFSQALFKLFINDLPQYLENTADPIHINGTLINCLMYADDNVLLSNSADDLQQKLYKLQEYCNDWCLSVNVNKTKVIVFNKAGRLINTICFLDNKVLECVQSYKYLVGILFSASGSFTAAQEELYKKALKALSKLQRDFLCLNPSISTALHVFNHTIKPILLYGCEIWSSFNLKSSKYRNGITLEKIFSKSLKFYKFVLGVHKKSSIFAVFSELGCFPIYFDIVKTTSCYQNRLENLGNKFPVLSASYTESKLNSSKNKPSWYSSSEALCNLSCLINLKPKNFKNKCVAKLRIYFISYWHTTRTYLSDGKLRTYLKDPGDNFKKWNYVIHRALSVIIFDIYLIYQ